MGVGPRHGAQRWGGEMGGAKVYDAILDEDLTDVSLDELREFIEADVLDVKADPEFKEELRKKLWELLQARSGPSGLGDDDV